MWQVREYSTPSPLPALADTALQIWRAHRELRPPFSFTQVFVIWAKSAHLLGWRSWTCRVLLFIDMALISWSFRSNGESMWQSRGFRLRGWVEGRLACFFFLLCNCQINICYCIFLAQQHAASHHSSQVKLTCPPNTYSHQLLIPVGKKTAEQSLNPSHPLNTVPGDSRVTSPSFVPWGCSSKGSMSVGYPKYKQWTADGN